ncbi:hypothetical protein B0H14DRAFT_3500876 [Mycena olivaceomarginata]|nr:hypothetical protein B0H14DRAFT_3500876 [Mycena olivaceomarginata]
MDIDNDAPGPMDDDVLPLFHPAPKDFNPSTGPASPDIGPGTASPAMPVDGPSPPVGDLYDATAAANLRAATAAAREGVWSNGHRVVVEEEPEEEDPDTAMDAEMEGEDDFWGQKDYNEYEMLYGLPVGDMLEEEMERQLAEFAEELSDEDMAIFRAFALTAVCGT